MTSCILGHGPLYAADRFSRSLSKGVSREQDGVHMDMFPFSTWLTLSSAAVKHLERGFPFEFRLRKESAKEQLQILKGGPFQRQLLWWPRIEPINLSWHCWR